MCPANHINSRSLLRSSSTREPSDPPHKVVFVLNVLYQKIFKQFFTHKLYIKCDLKCNYIKAKRALFIKMNNLYTTRSEAKTAFYVKNISRYPTILTQVWIDISNFVRQNYYAY